MRQTRLVLVAVSMLTLALAPLAAAQMMGGMNSHSQMGQKGTLSHSATQEKGMATMQTPADTLANTMSQRCTTLMGDLENMESLNKNMMQVNDMKMLKGEMQKQQAMMQQMHKQLARQQDMWKNMMSMMPSGGMQGMMGMTSDQTMTGSSRNH